MERTYERIDEIRKHKNLFLTGPAGRGKTGIIQQLVNEDWRWGILSATTGVAALNLSHKKPVPTVNALLESTTTSDFKHAYDRGLLLKRLRTLLGKQYERLIIDECSMLCRETFGRLYHTCKQVGIGLVLVGDFLQLPPVVKAPEAEIMKSPWMAFDSPMWKKFTEGNNATDGKNIIRLTTNHRQSDVGFIALLDALRSGDGAKADELLSRSGVNWSTRLSGMYDDNFVGLTLVPDNASRDSINEIQYGKCQGREVTFSKYVFGERKAGFNPEWHKIENTVKLKEGARVMVTRNHYQDGSLDYANGTCGEVVSIVPDSPGKSDGHVKVKSDNHGFIRVDRVSEDNSQWIEDYDPESGKSHWTKIEPTAGINYLPLTHAWASTIHKAQGLSLDKVQICLDAPCLKYPQTAASLLYVAMSRAKTGKGVYLAGSSNLRDVCWTNPQVSMWI